MKYKRTGAIGGTAMEKAVTVIGKAAVAGRLQETRVRHSAEEPRDHIKVWREIYQDVRRQWAEAEQSRCRRRKPGR